MRITVHEVSKGKGGQALPTTSLEFHTGAVRFALAETEQRPTVLGLIASGRMRPDSGTVTIDGAKDNRMLRRTVALVDAPDVSDPHPDITLAGVVGEELMFAGLGATPLHARRWLTQLGFSELAGVPIGSVDPAARVRILCELAVLREGTKAIVLVAPDRHGGSPDGWWRIASEFADRGYAMLVIVGGSAAVALERMQELGAINASGPVTPLDPADLPRPLSEDDEVDGPLSEDDGVDRDETPHAPEPRFDSLRSLNDRESDDDEVEPPRPLSEDDEADAPGPLSEDDEVDAPRPLSEDDGVDRDETPHATEPRFDSLRSLNEPEELETPEPEEEGDR